MLVQGDDNFAVAVAFERVFLAEFFPVFLVVIEFAIDDGVDRIVRVVEWLVSCGTEIDDREADVTEAWRCGLVCML